MCGSVAITSRTSVGGAVGRGVVDHEHVDVVRGLADPPEHLLDRGAFLVGGQDHQGRARSPEPSGAGASRPPGRRRGTAKHHSEEREAEPGEPVPQPDVPRAFVGGPDGAAKDSGLEQTLPRPPRARRVDEGADARDGRVHVPAAVSIARICDICRCWALAAVKPYEALLTGTTTKPAPVVDDRPGDGREGVLEADRGAERRQARALEQRGPAPPASGRRAPGRSPRSTPAASGTGRTRRTARGGSCRSGRPARPSASSCSDRVCWVPSGSSITAPTIVGAPTAATTRCDRRTHRGVGGRRRVEGPLPPDDQVGRRSRAEQRSCWAMLSAATTDVLVGASTPSRGLAHVDLDRGDVDRLAVGARRTAARAARRQRPRRRPAAIATSARSRSPSPARGEPGDSGVHRDDRERHAPHPGDRAEAHRRDGCRPARRRACPR